ncbi:hypothetical protein D3C74_413800 [compost metagenome]
MYGAWTTISSIPPSCMASLPSSIYMDSIGLRRVFCGAPVYIINELEPYEDASFVALNNPLSEKDTWEPIFSIIDPPYSELSLILTRLSK